VATETLHPTPHSWWEKAYDTAGIYVGLGIVIAATIPVLEPLGFWSWLTVILVTNIALQLALAFLLIAPLRRKREALNAAMGLVECSLRSRSLPPGPPPPAASYRRGYLIGYAKTENGALIFQPRTVFTGVVVGSPMTFRGITPLTGGLRTPTRAPWYLGRGWTVVYVKTDIGVIELAGSIHGLKAAGVYPTGS
jgi:hypothetical protein